ncbi:MAG TPA: hypothetical protein VEY09_00320 [Pyrinomonadaceae bacterium]|nr:hypothetical protein [Pyrinomonadaceae bacterium]
MNRQELVPLGSAPLATTAAADVNNKFAAGIKDGGDFLPSLSLKGRQFHIKSGGQLVSLDNRTLDVILVTARDGLSKSYYVGPYVPGENKKPDCQSSNGLTPDVTVAAPQSETCARCPQNAWGSKINATTGAQGKACADTKVLILAPPSLDGDKPLLLALPAASLKNFAAYIKLLNHNGLRADQVITRLVFTADAFPKLDFQYVQNLDAASIAAAAGIAERDDVQAAVNPPVAAAPTLVQVGPAVAQTPTSTPPVTIQQPSSAPVEVAFRVMEQTPGAVQPPPTVGADVGASGVVAASVAGEAGTTDEVADILGRWGAQAK